MKVARGYPPNYEQIRRKFKLRGRNVVFTYGDTVYNPNGDSIPDHLEAHEATHVEQQAISGPESWWKLYLNSPRFRLEQELEAYINQYRYIKEHYGRQDRIGLLKKIAGDLASELYVVRLKRRDAERLITEEAELTTS